MGGCRAGSTRQDLQNQKKKQEIRSVTSPQSWFKMSSFLALGLWGRSSFLATIGGNKVINSITMSKYQKLCCSPGRSWLVHENMCCHGRNCYTWQQWTVGWEQYTSWFGVLNKFLLFSPTKTHTFIKIVFSPKLSFSLSTVARKTAKKRQIQKDIKAGITLCAFAMAWLMDWSRNWTTFNSTFFYFISI